MNRRSILFVVGLVLWSPGIVFADFVVYSDDFSTDTTANYTWVDEGSGGDGDPANNYTYDSVNQWLNITTANNENIYMGAYLSNPIETGHFEISFLPYATYPVDGLVQIRLYGADGTLYSYHWDFAHDSGSSYPGDPDLYQYRAHLEKWVDGVPVIQEIFVPSPSDYELDVWHTLAVDFSALCLTGSLDGQSVLTMDDPGATSIAIESFQISFRQQDQYVDDILFTGQSCVVRLPGAALLGVLGLGCAGTRLRRQTRNSGDAILSSEPR